MPAFNAVRFNEPTCKALYDRVFERSGIKPGRRSDESLRGCSKATAADGLHEVDYDPAYLAHRASKDKKIVPPVGTTQDQVAVAELSYL